MCSSFLGYHGLRGEHAEQAGSGVVVLDLLHGRGVRGSSSLPARETPQDLAEVHRSRVPR